MPFDTAAFERALAEKAARLAANAKAEERRLAEWIAQRSRELVAPHRDTGETEDSLRVEESGDGTTIHGENPYLEFGTSEMEARPFRRPAIAEARSQFKAPDFH